MKGLFPEFDIRADIDFKKTWQQATFIFDTNVLLNLYRYQEGAREELLKLLENLSANIWIPYYVALEFQRNRLSVIAGQGKQFSEVRKAIEKARTGLTSDIQKLQLKKRHALIDPEPLLESFGDMTDQFLAQLEELRKSQQGLTSHDPLKQRIEELFEGKVGAPPENQTYIDALTKEAENRYKFKIPPGYEDDSKDKNGPDEFLHAGIIYKKKLGDFLIWRQILKHTEENKKPHVIFVTDDGKEDWWAQMDLEGPKTIGPRPELIDESKRLGNIDTFLMYKPESFLEFAKEFFSAEVSEETLSEVRDVSKANRIRRRKRINILDARTAVRNWLASRHTSIDDTETIPDFIVERNGMKIGYEVYISSNSPDESDIDLMNFMSEDTCDSVKMIIVVSKKEDVSNYSNINDSLIRHANSSGIEIIFGLYGVVDGDPIIVDSWSSSSTHEG